MKVVAFFFRNSRNLLACSVVIAAFSGVCNAALLASINSSLKSEHREKVVLYAFWGLCIMLPLARYASEAYLTKLGQQAIFDLRMKLCRQILSTPLRHLEQLGAPKLLAALTDDVTSITNVLPLIPVLCVNAALVAGSLTYLALLSPQLLALVLGFMVLGIATYQLPIFRVTRIFQLARKNVDFLQASFRGLIYGIKELQINSDRRNTFVKGDLEQTATSLVRQNTSALNLYSAAASWGQVLVFVLIGLIVFGESGLHQASLSVTTGYTLSLLYLITPLQAIMNGLPLFTRANVALQKLVELEFALAESQTGPSKLFVAGQQWHELAFRSLTHRYQGENETNFVLGPLNLTFRPREITFIVGGNGSGKTTLVKLLTGLYKPEKGTITINDETIDESRMEQYRQRFSIVFSDFYLFETIPGSTKPGMLQQIEEYLELFQLGHKVCVIDGRFSTIDLSQGQRKRLAMLSILLEDRPIYVFDEWAADQDPSFKNIFYRQILPDLKSRGKTVFVISHDDRYYDVADRLIKLEEGQIVSDVTGTTNVRDLSVSKPHSQHLIPSADAQLGSCMKRNVL
ncbi:MAG TPA: cyclic peptide export ABC transporter [Candidatus Angelobacter sp.]